MPTNIIKISSISQLHTILELPKPKHPLISLIDVAETQIKENQMHLKVTYDLYMISLKDQDCGIEYGRNSFDFGEGVMVYSAPGQVYTPIKPYQKGDIEGWMLFFHPDLIRNTNLGNQIADYSFFNYDVAEALHLSDKEEKTINNTVFNIQYEYEQTIDNHSQRVIVSNIELLLNYCRRFYERQFNTRTTRNKDILSIFYNELKKYFRSERQLESGLPSVKFFAEQSQLSQHYFSDLIKKETGRNPKDHINDFIIEKAKDLLLGTEQNISEIAYNLGFNYPHYFTRLFKSKTGQTPVEYRSVS